MKNLDSIISDKIIEVIWDRVAAINSALDDAYGSGLSGHYASALRCAAEAVEAYEELINLCAATTEQPLREHLRDAVGSVKLDKFFNRTDSVYVGLKEKASKAIDPLFDYAVDGPVDPEDMDYILGGGGITI